jgi:hypothetical protein
MSSEFHSPWLRLGIVAWTVATALALVPSATSAEEGASAEETSANENTSALEPSVPREQASPDTREPLQRIDARYADAVEDEVPDFQRHISPLLGRLGCNGRACHGSFQGRGDFRLSLFGYDFKADHKELTGGDQPRVDLKDIDESLILAKPTDEDMHEGGQRYEKGGWEYHVLRRWIESGAKYDASQPGVLVRLEITPSEILFHSDQESVQLKVTALWEDGSREDVTPLCRFQTNDEPIATIDENGLVTAGEQGDTHVVVFYDNGVVPVPVLRPVSDRVGENFPDVPTPTTVDKLVVQKLRKLGLVPSELASDAEFLRRVCLDMTGSLPTPHEVESFLADDTPDKRAHKIDQLLESPAYAAWWATKLCDFTGNNDANLVNVTPARNQASRDWYEWIHKRVTENVPYDDIVEGIVLAVSREEDEDFATYSQNMSALYKKKSEGSFADREHLPHYWARRDFREPDARAISFAYAFLGIRIQCAQCHKHPFDQWSKDDFEQFTSFFSGVNFGTNPASRKEYAQMIKDLGLDDKRGGVLRRELSKMLTEGESVPFQEVYAVANRKAPNKNKKAKGKGKQPNPAPVTARALGSDPIELSKYKDVRKPLMDWLRDQNNPYFARSFVNRVWSGYFNVGIVNPPDDLSLANPPSNGPLLDYLAAGFIEHDYDMKWLHREIANSRTYQLSWKPNETNRLDETNFSHSIPRRLPAEVAFDALQQATASDDQILAMHEEAEGRAIAIPGTTARGSKGEAYALEIFGRSTRESNCECDRSSEVSLLQTVFLRNDQQLLAAIDRNKNGWVDQVADSLGVKRARPDAQAKKKPRKPARPKNYDDRIAGMKKRIETLETDGKTKQAKAIAARLLEFEKRFASDEDIQDSTAEAKADRPRGDKSSAAEPTLNKSQADDLVRQAYLRCLSRYPRPDEQARAVAYLQQSEDAVEGVRDLLWTLINTKEFIVNH